MDSRLVDAQTIADCRERPEAYLLGINKHCDLVYEELHNADDLLAKSTRNYYDVLRPQMEKVTTAVKEIVTMINTNGSIYVISDKFDLAFAEYTTFKNLLEDAEEKDILEPPIYKNSTTAKYMLAQVAILKSVGLSSVSNINGLVSQLYISTQLRLQSIAEESTSYELLKKKYNTDLDIFYNNIGVIQTNLANIQTYIVDTLDPPEDDKSHSSENYSVENPQSQVATPTKSSQNGNDSLSRSNNNGGSDSDKDSPNILPLVQLGKFKSMSSNSATINNQISEVSNQKCQMK